MLLDWLNVTMHRELLRLASMDREREREKIKNYREGTVQRREAAFSRDVFHYVFHTCCSIWSCE
jgi:hypothetical protein